MPQEKIIIKFQAKGDKALEHAIRQLHASQVLLEKGSKAYKRRLKELNIQMKKYNGESVTGIRNNRLLANSFATIRSKMLLFSFAMSMGLRQLIQFTEEAAKVEAMGMAFDTLSGGGESASIAMEKLQEATNGTMNQFNLFQQANNAMILGVSKNSDEMAEMFDIAQRLGRALGRDTASSVESLITGIGRQSRLMLDNIGIIVKAEEAYESFANALGVSVDELSDADKKQAFLNATMESARAKVKSLGDEVIVNQDSFDRLKATIDDLTVSIGTKLKGSFASVADDLSDFLESSQEVTQESLMSQKTTQRNALVWSNLADAFQKTSDVLTDTDLRNRLKELRTGDIGESFEWEDLGISSDEFIGRVETNFDKYIQKQEEVKISNQNLKPSAFEIMQVYAEQGNLAQKSISLLADEMARLVLETGSLKSLKPAEVLAPFLAKLAMTTALLAGFGAFFPKLGIGGLGGAFKLALGVGHKGGLIKDDGKVQRFATGGSVRGGDNVPILAQGGEFVMQRSAVNSIGIENLNRMNEGGGGSAVTVNVSGNVLSQDFVEGELAENIKEAIRRGTDFGIS